MSADGNLFTTGQDDPFDSPHREVPGHIGLTDAREAGSSSVPQLVRDAGAQISALISGEIELAKAEIAESAKKGAIGGGLFTVAGAIALFSSFFFFFFVAELLALCMPRWAAFGLVFVLILVLAGVFVLVGVKMVKKLRKPEATIESVGQLQEVLPGRKPAESKGLYS